MKPSLPPFASNASGALDEGHIDVGAIIDRLEALPVLRSSAVRNALLPNIGRVADDMCEACGQVGQQEVALHQPDIAQGAAS
ncbi:hypothetical protein [Erythrobacter sp. HL-111]|uniref:hypothetical protein n=1 Tax=Erythrobacter sp. HL-111 TaxID=1798193 RepID=UPI0018D3EA6A|nr:hypothetical protein [Erythrobacter sp. HL-111]